jgi:hypothetical protein
MRERFRPPLARCRAQLLPYVAFQCRRERAQIPLAGRDRGGTIEERRHAAV